MKSDRYLNTDIYIEESDLKNVRLLQSKLAKLSTFRCNEGAIKSITNCSFFNAAGGFTLGRDQGDERNETYSDDENMSFADVVIFKDGSYAEGYMNNYDYRDDVVCGFSGAALLISGGEDCELYSTPISDVKTLVSTKQPRTAFAITKDNKAIQFVSEGRSTDDAGLTGFEVREYLKTKYDIQTLAILDGGGSTELIENGFIVNNLTDGNERAMLNGIAFIETPEELKFLYPCASGGDAQGFKPGVHYGLDFGWISNMSDDILATADGEVTFEGFYNDIIGGKTYRPIGVIIKHAQFSEKYDYYSLYTHLASTSVNKGQKVKTGEVIGVKGNTGYSKGKHLHFQVMRMPKGASLTDWNKNAIDPTRYLYRTANQVFRYQGLFDIPLVEEVQNKPADIPEVIDWKYKYEEVLRELSETSSENYTLKEQNMNLKKNLEHANIEIEELMTAVNDVIDILKKAKE